MNEPMLSKPKNIFERLLRKLGILKRININNHSCCDIRIINDNQNGNEWLKDVLLTGFVGYNNQSYEEILQEFNERLQE